jgi:hypothetical protein
LVFAGNAVEARTLRETLEQLAVLSQWLNILHEIDLSGDRPRKNRVMRFRPPPLSHAMRHELKSAEEKTMNLISSVEPE